MKANNKILSRTLTFMLVLIMLLGCMSGIALAAPADEVAAHKTLVESLPISDSIKSSVLFYLPLNGDFSYDGKSTNTVAVENSETNPITFVDSSDRGAVAKFTGNHQYDNSSINLGLIDYGKGDTTMDVSFACWIKNDATSQPDPAIVSNKNWWSGANAGFYFGCYQNHSLLRLNLKAEGQNRVDMFGTPVNDNNWHYVVMTMDRHTGVYTLFVDGVKVETATYSNTALLDINTGFPTRIGSDGIGQTGFVGLMSDFMMFDTALSAAEVTELMEYFSSNSVTPAYPEATYDGNLVNNLPASVKDDILFYFPLKNGFNYGGKSTNTVTVENDLTGYAAPISFVRDANRGIVADFKGVGDGSDTRLNNNINLGMIDYGKGDNTMDFSFGFWYKAAVNRPGPTFVSNKNWYSGANPGYVVGQETSAGVLRLNLKAEGQIRIDSINNTSVADGKWHYMVLTLDRQAGTYTLYKDGVQAEVANNSNTALLDINTIYPTRIGSDGLGQFGLDGQLSEFVMFDKALSAVEVMELAKSYGLEPPKSPLTYTLSNEKTDAQVGDMFTTTLKIENKTADIYDNVSATLVTSGHNSKTAQVTLSTQDVLLPGESTTLTWTTKVTSGGLISTIVYINADDSDTAKIQGQPVNIPTNSAGWYNVDGHSHTVYSDGSGTVAQNLEQARQNAVNALVQTDHHNSNGWNDAKTYVANNPENGMLPIRGNEYTTSTGHAIVLDIPESFVSTSYSGLSWKAMLAQAKTMGSLLFIAHPFEPGGTFWNHGYDDEGYVGLEVWSNYWGPRFAYNQQAFDKWDALNREGRKLYGITVTDAHSARMIGQNWMSVYLPNGLNTKNLMEGMSVGSMYGSNGPHLELTAVANGKTGMMGDSLEVVAAGQDITFNVKGNYADGLNRLIVIKNGVKEQTITIGDISFDKNITLNVKPGDFVRVELEGYEAYGKTFVTNNTHATDGKCAPFAFSNPIFFDEGEEVVDKTALDAVIAEAELLDENKYTADSWNVLAAALENAKAVNASETCTQAQVDAAAEELKAAIEALVAKTFTVKFVDFDGTVLKEDTVKYGKAAAAPADPAREGYTFDGWDEDFSNITADMTVTAQYTINAVSPTLKNAATSANEFISIEETKKNSGVWILSFTVMETYSNGEIKVVSYAVEINANNANVDGSYDLGSYALIYDIKGNGSNIKEFRIILN